MSNLAFSSCVPNLVIANRTFTDLKNLIMLFGQVSTAGTAYSTPRLPGAAAGYQVTAGKTLTILAGRMSLVVNAASSAFYIGYGDTDSGVNNGSPPTNLVYMTASQNFAHIFNGAVGVGYYEHLCNFAIPATKYVNISGATGGSLAGSFIIFGYET